MEENEDPFKRQVGKAPLVRKLIKLEDYLAASPESKCDLTDGNYFYHAPASYKHNKIRGFLETIIRYYIEKFGFGELVSENFPIKLNESNWREPDLVYISKDHLKDMKETIFTGVPDFIIEIVSEDSRYRDEVRKRAEYERLGVNEYWIIDPESFDNSTFLRLKEGRFVIVNFSTEKIEMTSISGLFFKKKWIWSSKGFSKLEVVFKELGLT